MSDNELIINMSENKRREHYFIKHHNNLYLKLIEFKMEMELDNFTQVLYHYVNGKTVPKCKICGEKVNFISFNKGYRQYCSKKCTMLDAEIVEKRNKKSIETNLKRFGVDNISKLESNKEKIKNTSLKKWGVENFSQTSEWREKVIEKNNQKYGCDWYMNHPDFFEKSKKTNIDKIGVDHHTKTNEYKEKIKKNNLQKWGVECFTKTEEFKKLMVEYYSSEKFKINIENQKSKIKLHLYNFYKNYNKNYDLLEIDNLDNLILKCPKCNKNFKINKQLFYLRTKSKKECCTKCNPTNGKNTSFDEKEIFNYIKQIYSGKIIENYTINNMEIDIYLPEKKIGIEYNGLYWHCELNKQKLYHINKLNFFNTIGIELLNIWEDDWKYKCEIIKSIIKNKLNLNDNKIWARKCEILEISNKQYLSFLDQNHLQGKINSSIKIGLFHKNELVSVMSFGKLRKSLGNNHQINKYEMLRFCNKLNTSVVGGASKLLKYFIRNYSPNYILSYADRCHSNGNLYEKIGFKNKSITQPNYYWYKKGIRHNRFSFRKDILVKRGYDPNKTEAQIMNELKFYKIYNCGNFKFEMDIHSF